MKHRRHPEDYNPQKDSRQSAGPVAIQPCQSEEEEEEHHDSPTKQTLLAAPTHAQDDEKLSASEQEIGKAIVEEVERYESEKASRGKGQFSPKTSFLEYPDSVKDSVKMTSSVLVDSKGNVIKQSNPGKVVLIFVVILLVLLGFGLMGELQQDAPAKATKKPKPAKKKPEKVVKPEAVSEKGKEKGGKGRRGR